MLANFDSGVRGGGTEHSTKMGAADNTAKWGRERDGTGEQRMRV